MGYVASSAALTMAAKADWNQAGKEQLDTRHNRTYTLTQMSKHTRDDAGVWGAFRHM
jgi:hypothetical protein